MAAINEKELNLLEKNLQRIFAMNIMRSTFREVQNTVLASANGDKDRANTLFESLMVGEVKDGIAQNKAKDLLQDIIERFTIPIRLAREVYERGDFVNIITSDMLTQNNRFLFLNRVRRVDGEEFQFITDTESTIHLLNHFVGRLQDLEKTEGAKKVLTEQKKQLSEIQTKLKQLMS